MLRHTLNAEAPSWLQAGLFGLLTGTIVFLTATMVVLVTPLGLHGYAVWLIPTLVALIYLVWYLPQAAARVETLRGFTHSLAASLGESVELTRARVWSWRGPAWRTMGLTPLFAPMALVFPVGVLAATLWSSSLAADIDGSGRHAPSLTSVVIVAVAALMIAAIIWLIYRTSKRSPLVRLLVSAAQDPSQREALIRDAVDSTCGDFPRPASFWIGAAFLATWGGSYAFGSISSAVPLATVAWVAVWVVVSVLLTVPAIRGVRRQGAPELVWIGVAIYPIAAAVMSALVYAGLWDAFGQLITEKGSGGWPAPEEFVRSQGLTALTYVPMIVAAWVTSKRSGQTGVQPPAEVPLEAE